MRAAPLAGLLACAALAAGGAPAWGKGGEPLLPAAAQESPSPAPPPSNPYGSYEPPPPGAPAAVPEESVARPAPAAPPVSAERQGVLVEMRERGILEPGALGWSPHELDLLERARKAERSGAFDLLRAHLGDLRGYAVVRRPAPGIRQLRLTRAGYERYLFLKSQLARQYLESRGGDAKRVFRFSDVRGRLLFDDKGLLTQDGEDFYERAARAERVGWRDETGSLRSAPASR